MDQWFASLSKATELLPETVNALQTDGFAVIPGPVPMEELAALAHAYDQVVTHATSDDIRIGSTNTRVSDFINRNAEFDCLYLYPPLLEACCRVIEQPFKLSTMHARTVRPHVPAQRLHVDFPSDAQAWPMVGFIFMVDDFAPENGATYFIRGSQGMKELPASYSLTPACGPAGSMIVFNGSVWHGHGPNQTNQSRRSIQGAYIRRTETSGANLPGRMQPETLHRLGGLAKYLLAL